MVGDLRPGDGLLLRAFKDHPTPEMTLDYRAPSKRGSYHLALWLGIWSEGTATVDDRLNALGWVFDPMRAAQAIEARSGETREAGLDPKPASPVPNGDAPLTDHLERHPNDR